WVIVDDGSTDLESVKRLDSVASRDERIKVIRQENAGPSAARNTAFRNAKGRYVCLLDSDDMVEPTYLEKAAWFLDSHPEFAFCNSYSVIFGEQEYLWTTGFERGKAHLQANSGPPISLIRSTAYAECGGFDESIRIGHEDWDFWLAMAKAGHWGYTIPEYLQWYRKRGNGRFEQIMRSGNTNAEFEKLMHRKYEGLDKHFPAPATRYPSPYEEVATAPVISNRLKKNASGRRIMFIVPWMVTGGADRVNLDLIEGLISEGHEVTVCATLRTDHQWEHQFSRFTPDIFVLPNFLYVSDYPRFLAYMIESRQVDSVVITGSTIGYQLLPYLRAVSPDVAFVDMSHVEEPHWLNGGHPRFGVGYQDVLDLSIVTTRHLADWMQARGADGERIRVMYTGVRTADFKQLSEARACVRAELGIQADMPLIVFAGRICEQKRPALLAEILKATCDQGLRFRALVIGDGELRGEFEKLLKQYCLTDCVRMLGSVPHQQWLNILAGADILLMPSQYEGISIALLEAIAAGVVPVVAKVGGQEEIVSPEAGILVQQHSDELREYATAIRNLLSDPNVMEQMSLQCKILAATKLSWQNMICNFLSILNEAHQLKVEQPRILVSKNFGLELAKQALECKRLGETVDWLWGASPNPDLAGTSSSMTKAIARFAIYFSKTWLGQKLVRNKHIKNIGKSLLRRMRSPSVA
ncbi:MAG TPA: glycosyltransferase, partial [Gallionella sp.]|nr:glycosyltransferase [Gallionella sp.]